MGRTKEREKVVNISEMEFINEVANDCILNMSDKDKECIIDNPRAIEYHFSYCLYIRNHYIHNRDFSEATFYVEPDDLSSKIIRVIFSKLLPEYILENSFIEELYEHKGFIKLRREYKNIYGNYPTDMVAEYSQKIVLEATCPKSEWRTNTEIDLDEEFEKYKRNHEIIKKTIVQFNKELAELVWRTDSFKEIALECGISYDNISKKVEKIKQIFYEKGDYVPLEVCLLPYKKKIGKTRYLAYRKALSKQLSDNPELIERLDKVYFYDRVLARSVLKYGWTLCYLSMYKDDDAMVKYCLKHNGEAIQYASKRFRTDREWVKYAIEHSKNGTIMSLDCMKPYRKDKELVYLACKVDRWNFVFVDKSYRDDFELAKICMEEKKNPNTIFSYLSKQLKDNKELVMLDLQERFPSAKEYSARLRNDDEVAAKLYELHGTDSWAWYYMSKRLKKKYGIVD